RRAPRRLDVLDDRAARHRRRQAGRFRAVGDGRGRAVRLFLHAADDARSVVAAGGAAATRVDRCGRVGSEPAHCGDVEADAVTRAARARRLVGRHAGFHRRRETVRSWRLADALARGAQPHARSDRRLRGRRYRQRSPDAGGRGTAMNVLRSTKITKITKTTKLTKELCEQTLGGLRGLRGLRGTGAAVAVAAVLIQAPEPRLSIDSPSADAYLNGVVTLRARIEPPEAAETMT